MNESQTTRIKRLGNPEHIWNGQSDFWLPLRFPVLELVVIPGSAARAIRCNACGAELGGTAHWGALSMGEQVIVQHITKARFDIYHVGCAPSGVRWIHALPETPQIGLFEHSTAY